MSNEIKIVATLLALPGQTRAVEHALRACVAPSRAEPGCHFYDLHQDRNEPRRFVFIEGWADLAAIEQHKVTPHYQAMALAVSELLEAREVLQLDQLDD